MIPGRRQANVGLVTTDKGRCEVRELYTGHLLVRQPKTNPPWRQRNQNYFWWYTLFGPRSQTVDEAILQMQQDLLPLFEGGSHLALWSGREAAQVIAEAIESGELSKSALKKYERHGRIHSPHDKILKGKTSLYGLSDAEMSEMANFLPEELDNMFSTETRHGLRI